MSEKKAPEILSAEAINALAQNAEAIKNVLSSNDEKMALGCGGTECCCPRLVKFKFVLCNVWIDVENAACPSNFIPALKE